MSRLRCYLVVLLAFVVGFGIVGGVLGVAIYISPWALVVPLLIAVYIALAEGLYWG